MSSFSTAGATSRKGTRAGTFARCEGFRHDHHLACGRLSHPFALFFFRPFRKRNTAAGLAVAAVAAYMRNAREQVDEHSDDEYEGDEDDY